MSLPSNLRQTIINLSNAAQLQAFGPGDHEHLIYRIDGEMRERRRHVSALPYHAQTRWRALTKQALGRALKGEINEFEVSARARSLIIAYDLAVDEAHRFQSGWLRRLGVTLTPSTAERMPLLTRADVSEILINFLPRAYRDASTHLVPDDYELWAQWLKSPEYAQVHALAPSAAATRLKTRSREWRQRLVRTLGARTQ
jgi:hypothetical protein